MLEEDLQISDKNFDKGGQNFVYKVENNQSKEIYILKVPQTQKNPKLMENLV